MKNKDEIQFILAFDRLQTMYQKAFLQSNYDQLIDQFQFTDLSTSRKIIPTTWHIDDIKNALEFRLIKTDSFQDADYETMLDDVKRDIENASIQIGNEIIDRYVQQKFANQIE